MKKLGIACLVGSMVVLAGCSGMQTTGSNLEAKVPAGVAPQYESDAVRQQLVDMGLIQPLSDYWSAYVARDWARRYRMEEFQKPQEQDFYVAYHAAAWQLLEMRVEAVDASGAPDRVRINLRVRFRNPERPAQERTSLLQDLWTKREQGWQHVNSDPMLNGLRAVK